MYRASLMLLLGALFFAGCDLFRDDAAEPETSLVEAVVNGQPWTAFPSMAIVYTNDVYVPQNDSLLTMQFDAVRPDGFRHGALVLSFMFRGVGDYDIQPTASAIIQGDPDGPDTLQANVSFFDTQHNQLIARLGLEEDDEFLVRIDDFDREALRIRGTFSGTLVFAEGEPDTNPARNYPNAITFSDGAFEGPLEFVRADEGQPAVIGRMRPDPVIEE